MKTYTLPLNLLRNEVSRCSRLLATSRAVGKPLHRGVYTGVLFAVVV